MGLAELWGESCKHTDPVSTASVKWTSSHFHCPFQWPTSQTNLPPPHVFSIRRCSTGKRLVIKNKTLKLNLFFLSKTFQEQALQNTSGTPRSFTSGQSSKDIWLMNNSGHLWPTFTLREATDSNPGFLTALPTHPENPATLSSLWSSLVLRSRLPPCFPNQTGLFLASSNNKKKFIQQKSQHPNI